MIETQNGIGMKRSFWDRPRLGQFFREQGSLPELAERNLRRRTEFLEEMDPSCPAAAEEVEGRRRAWLDRRDAGAGPPAPLVLEVVGYVVLACIASLMVRSVVFRYLVISLAVLVFIRLCVLVRRRHRRRRALLDRCCPDCDYLVSEQPGDFGPARCPECGSPWPLVPRERQQQRR